MSEPTGNAQSGTANQAGSSGSNSAEGNQGATNQGSGSEGRKTDGDAQNQDPNASRFLTKEAFQGVLTHLKTTIKADLAAGQKDTLEKIGPLLAAEIAKALEQSGTKAKKSKTDKEGTDESGELELNTLKRQLEEAQKAHQGLRAELDAERARAKEAAKAAMVTDALRRNDCTRPDIVYKVIQDLIGLSEDGKTAFATVKDEWENDTKVALDEFIKGEVSQKIMPELFKGANRGGTPASGDSGATGGQFKFTRQQLKDPEYYRKFRDQIDAAAQRGQIKDMQPQGQA